MHGETSFDVQYTKVVRRSKAAYRWLRLKFRVRVVGRLSLMRAASAERLYSPGGGGALAAQYHFNELADLAYGQVK